MAVIKKTLFAKNLDKYAVLVNDTQPDSKYFKISELPDTFTGGKNAFLIAGSEYLVPDTKIQIELKDSAGNVIYHEPGEGVMASSINGESFVAEYYEGVSKVVAVYVYPDTAYGPCTLTILGELNQYVDGNGFTTPVSLDWENKYNVKWQKQINVNPSLANTTKIRFYQRPTATITELLSPLYRIENDLKVASAVTQSFANIKLSKLETFAGDVKRVKVFRTSQGDISDYDLIQDILVESKELLTSYGLSGSVVGETGILTSETLKNYWKTGSLNAFLTSSRVESGVRLTGSGNFRYSSSLDIKSTNTYELNLDAFYSSSTSSNLGIYLSYVSQSTTFTSSLATLVGTQPTKNLLDTVIPFKIDRDYPSASLYFSQSQGEWHLGNISLKLSQDTAFSPDEVSFVTTMPTVLGGETFNFKFEFYDVNNNYVPVEVTQSALFTGGNNNLNGTLTLISSSTSASLDIITKVSSSISGTMTVYSSSASSSVGSLSGSVSSSLSALSSSVSASNTFILSSSLSKVQQLANGQYSGSFIGDTVIYSPTIGGQQGYISSLFKVGTAPSIYLDARQNPRKIFIGGAIPSGQTEYSGAYNNTNTNIYLDSDGKFSLGNQLSWSGNALTVNGTINVAGGNAATNSNLSSSLSNVIASGSVSAASAQTAAELFASSAAGRAVTSGSNAASAAETAAIAQAKADASASVNLLANGNWTAGSGTFITSNSISSPVIAGNAGYISEIFRVGQNGITLDGGNKKIFVGAGSYNNANTPFYFASGSTNIFSLGTGLTWNGSALNVVGAITAESGYIGTAAAGWTIASNKIYNNNVDIDNTNSKIDFKSGGVIKTTIKSGNADIGSFTTTPITIAAGSTSSTTQNGSAISPGPLVVQNSSGGNTAEVTFTTPAAANGRPFSITVPYPALSNVGFSTVSNKGTGTSWDWSYSAGINYVIRLNNMSGALVAQGYKILSEGSTGTTISATGTVTHPGFAAGTMIIPNVATATTGQVYWISVTIGSTVQTRINPTGATPIGTSGQATAGTTGWLDTSGNAGLLAVASRAEYGTNGAQIGTSEGTYVAFGDAAGAGYVGVFNGNVQVIGVLTAGSISASDKRAKTNIKTIQNGIETINKLNPVSFDWLQHITGNNDFEKGYGFIADDVEKILPDLVYERKGYQFSDFKHLDYNSFHAITIKAIQELNKKIEELEAKISGSI
jgi:hypothetical protein